MGVSPDTLIPNRFLRGQVLKYKNESGSFRVIENNVRSPVINKHDDIEDNHQDVKDIKIDNGNGVGNNEISSLVDDKDQVFDKL